MKRCKSSWEQHDSEGEGRIGTPPDMRTFVESVAEYVAKHGLPTKIHFPENAGLNLNFLTSSEDPFHGYYQQKLSEFQKDGDNNNNNQPTEIIEPPHPDIGIIREKLARFLANVPKPDDLVEPQFVPLPDLLTRLPEGMNHREFVTMKLTAQFVGWYGIGFLLNLKEKDGFEFTKQTHSEFSRFIKFAVEYSKLLYPYIDNDTKSKLKEYDEAYMAAIHDGFSRLLEWDTPGEMKWQEGGLNSIVEWHASFLKEFANKAPPTT